MQEISDQMGDNQYASVKVTCMDCGKDFDLVLERTSPEQIKIENGTIGKRDGEYFFKCKNCWEIDKNFGRCTEIYSRVVGYLRPINNWNPSKQEEFNMRTPYKEV